MEQNNIFNISVSDRIVVSPKYRLTTGAYHWFKHKGWKYSRSRGGFVFNVNEEGAKRVRAILRFNPDNYSDYYFGSHDGASQDEITAAKEELCHAEFEYEGKAQEIIDKLLETVDKKAKAQAEYEEQRKERITNSRIDRFEAIKPRLKQLKNGYTTNMFDLSLSNFNMSDLLARKGVRCAYSMKELCEMFNLPSYEGADNDILQFEIHYANVWSNRWSDKPAARRLMLTCNHYSQSPHSNAFMEGGSGHFRYDIALWFDEPRIDYKKVVIASEIAGDDYKEDMAKMYLDYRAGKCNTTGEYINSIGMVSHDEVIEPQLAITYRARFDRALA